MTTGATEKSLHSNTFHGDPRPGTGAGRGREYEIASPRARMDNIARMHQRMRASN